MKRKIIAVVTMILVILLCVRFNGIQKDGEQQGEKSIEVVKRTEEETFEQENINTTTEPELTETQTEPVLTEPTTEKETEPVVTENPTEEATETLELVDRSDEEPEIEPTDEAVAQPTSEVITEETTKGSETEAPVNTALYGIELTKDVLEYDSKEDVYYVEEKLTEISGIIQLPEQVMSANILISNETGFTVLEREIVPAENFTITDFGLVIGVNNVRVQVEYEDGYVSGEEVSIYNYCDENMENLDIDFSDPDNDGLNNFVENMYGTNPNKADSDEDGLSDYEELVIIGTNANQKDSDSDGTDDSDEDIDNDGLTNGEEEALGTDNCTVDSDGDHLKDYDEVRIYMTNPLNKDSDGDGISDKWEVENNSDPNTYNEMAVYKGECASLNNRVEIELTASGSIIESFTMEVYKSNSVYLSVSLPGYMGRAYDFELDGEFESADIKYYFDEVYLEQENLNPTIYYFNEEAKELEEIETVWDGKSNYVTASLPHFSTYILLNKTDYKSVWENDIKMPGEDGTKETSMNIVFVVDVSGSMEGEKLTKTKDVINSFIDMLEGDDRAALVTFHHQAFLRSGLTGDKEVLKKCVNEIEAWGSTLIYNGIDLAVKLFENDDAAGYDTIIVITDGQDESYVTYETHYRDIIFRAISENITIHTIGIETINEPLLKKIAATTGGGYYYATYIGELQDKMDSIKQESIDYTSDSNNDNLTDYYAKLICSGELKLWSGDIIPQLIGSYEEFQKNDDFDGDGIKNGDEIIVKTSGQKVYFDMISNPAKADTDDDGFDDKVEYDCKTDPNIPNIRANVINYLLDNDEYMSADFTTEYRNNGWLRARIYGGNLLGNFKFSYIDDYKKALISFMQTYNEASYEAMMLQQTTDCMKAIELDLIYYVADCIMAAQKVEEQITDYDKLVVDLNACKERIDDLEELRDELLNYEKQPDNIGWQKELGEVINDINKLKNSNEGIKNEIKEVNVFGNMEDKLGKIKAAFPQKVIKGINKILNGISIAFDAGKIVLNTAEIIELYSSIEIGLQQQEELQILLFYVSSAEYNNDFMKAAALDLYLAMNDARVLYLSEAATILDEVNNGAGYMVATQFLSKTPIGRVIDVVWSVSNLIFHTGTVNEESIYLVAYGSSAMKYAQEIEKALINNKVSDSFYETNDTVNVWIQILGQLRIVAEDKFAETYSKNGYIIKLIDYINGCTEDDINEICTNTIDRVGNLCKANDIVVKKNFSGAYLNK